MQGFVVLWWVQTGMYPFLYPDRTIGRALLMRTLHTTRTIVTCSTTPPREPPLWGARRPAPPADPVPPVEHHDPRGVERRPRSKLGQTAGAMAPPAEQRGSRQLFNRTALPIGCAEKWRRGVGRQARQKPGELRAFARICSFGVGTNGNVPPFVPCSHDRPCLPYKDFTHNEDYRTPRVR